MKDRHQLQSHRYFHQGSVELDLINYSDYGLGGLGSLGHSLDFSDGSQGQPYPSPGSLCGLDRLAALGSMGPAGSITSSVYINPFQPAHPVRASQDSLASPRRRVKMSARSRSHELSEWGGGKGGSGGSGDLRDHKQRKPRTSQLRSLAGAQSGSVSSVDCNSCTDSPARESSFIETRNRNNRRSPALPGRIVGALNQGIASLGEKIVQEKPYSIVE